MNEHRHVKALLLGEIEQTLERLSKRGVGYIDGTNANAIGYNIDGVIYFISIRPIAESEE